jgi:Tfp pilus assembly protein PilF
MPGFPALTQSIYVSPNGNQQFMFDLAAGKAEQETQLAGRLNNATALFQQQQYDQALAECNAVLQIDPSDVDALKLRQQIQQTKSILGLQ